MAGNEAERPGNLGDTVAQVARHAAQQGWDKQPRLYSLATKSSIVSAVPELSSELAELQADDFVPIEQDPLPPGNPDEVISQIQWPPDVVGCVLVTEFIMLPSADEGLVPMDQAVAEEWAAQRGDGRRARLSVGVLRDGRYTCCLQYRDSDELVFQDDLADDVVAALRNTL